MGNSATLWTERESSSSFQGQAGGLVKGETNRRGDGAAGAHCEPLGLSVHLFLRSYWILPTASWSQVTARSCVHCWCLHTKNSSHRAWGMCVNRAPVLGRTELHYTCGFGGNIGWNRGPASHQLCSSELWVHLGPEQQQVGPCGFQFILWFPSGSWEILEWSKVTARRCRGPARRSLCHQALRLGERPKSWAVRTK